MNCQLGSRRCATWHGIEDAPQIKRVCVEKVHEEDQLQKVNEQAVKSHPSTPVIVPSNDRPVEQPKFYISSPIQGFTATKDGGCRYLFF